MKPFRNSAPLALFVLALGLAPSLAHAHPGHGGGFGIGLAHPLNGLDHLLAMLAVGLWAGQLEGRARWAVPAAFIGIMTLGSVLGMAGVQVPFVEAGILASVVILGLLIATGARLPLIASVALVGVFAAFHGIAHGAEIPGGASGNAYTVGFVLTTAGLHAVGLAVAAALRSSPAASSVRLAGGSVAVAGVMLGLN